MVLEYRNMTPDAPQTPQKSLMGHFGDVQRPRGRDGHAWSMGASDAEAVEVKVRRAVLVGMMMPRRVGAASGVDAEATRRQERGQRLHSW